MELDNELVKMEKSSNYRRYLLIIGILALSCSLACILRIQPIEYGFELMEFDPFFNYRATNFMVENGLPAYLEWNDDLSWHPYGRDISSNSQIMLHTSGALFYQIFGMGSSLYDFTILFPVVISSLTAVVIFALVRTIGGTTAGLLASLFFAVSPIIIMRGTLGWFKSEPLGLFYGLLAVYLVISAIKSDKGIVSIGKIVGAGILLSFGLASWGGAQFFVIPIGVFFLALPFLRKDNKFIIWSSALFTFTFLMMTLAFERTGLQVMGDCGLCFGFISTVSGFFLIGCTVILVACAVIKNLNKNQLRYGVALLGGAIITGIMIVSSGAITVPAFRYLNAANPFLITTDILTDSVSEHATTTIDISFFFFSTLMIFAGIGAWFLFQKKINHSLNIKAEMAAFALIIGFLGIYFSSAFVRLEVFGSISVIILSSIGVSVLISKILNVENKSKSVGIKISFLTVIMALLMVPMVYPQDGTNWTNSNISPISLLHSGTHFDVSTNDWPDAMRWLKENTSEDDVIAAWWDYGYWISTLSERKTLADNSTTLDWQIRKIAAMYLSTPNNAWKILTSDPETNVSSHYVSLPLDITKATRTVGDTYSEEENKFDIFKQWQDDLPLGYDEDVISKYPTLFDYFESEIYVTPPVLTGLDADYIIVNLAVKKLSADNVMDMYTIKQKGGDETKAFWFMKIANVPLLDYYNNERSGFTDKFWNETLLGNLIPFTVLVWVDPNNTEIQSKTFRPGYTAIYVKDIKFPQGGDGPFELVYVPPSFDRDEAGPLTGPLIYKINKNYNPNQ